MKTKLIIEEPQEIKGQGIVPKMRVWIARDDEGSWVFKEKPEYKKRVGWCSTVEHQSGAEFSLFRFPKWISPNLQEGECKEYEITFREVGK